VLGDEVVPSIVIVDDNEYIRQLLRDFLAHDGGEFQVVGQAFNGDEAVDVVARAKPDGIILDWQMPVLDGLGALPRLRQVAPDAVIVMYSSRGHGSAGEALAAGADAYVDKEDGPSAVVDRLRDLFVQRA
jgi:DNA-binding NarL/FixJ family response regulator